jgi:hypothetical protein
MGRTNFDADFDERLVLATVDNPRWGESLPAGRFVFTYPDLPALTLD